MDALLAATLSMNDDASGVVERLKAKHGLQARLDPSMILFHGVVQNRHSQFVHDPESIPIAERES